MPLGLDLLPASYPSLGGARPAAAQREPPRGGEARDDNERDASATAQSNSYIPTYLLQDEVPTCFKALLTV